MPDEEDVVVEPAAPHAAEAAAEEQADEDEADAAPDEQA
jgi:hypothetical protein